MEMVYSTLLLLIHLLSGGSGQEAGASQHMMASYLNASAGKTVLQAPTGTGAQAPDAGNGAFVKKDPQPDAPLVKGIYVTAHSAGGSRLLKLLSLTDRTELNSMVIDVKDDNGYITYPTLNPALLKLGTAKKYIADMPALMSTLQKHNIYPIARIVVFKDTVLAQKRPDLSFVRSDGSLWSNGKGDSFVNPYAKEVWDYNIEAAKEAVKLGFKEIQFDYVRFPEGFEKKAASLKYQKSDFSRVDAVAGFVKYAREQLAPLNVRVSVDIFGYAASVPAAEGIGQDFAKISKFVDVINPMVYPSHYSTGWFGAQDPDRSPYQVIKGAMADTTKSSTRSEATSRLSGLGFKTLPPAGWAADITSSMAKLKSKPKLKLFMTKTLKNTCSGTQETVIPKPISTKA